VPTLVLTDTGNEALSLMEENNLTQLPLLSDDKYMALVQETDVLDWDKPESPLSFADFLGYKPAILSSSHPYEALRISHQQNLSIVPVVDDENNYIGAITRNELLGFITENSGLNNPGGIMVLEIDPRNYSLYEIARICESEDVLIISSQLFTNRATGKLEVTIKTNRTNLEAVSASLERHNYGVKQVFGDEQHANDMLGRYELLMNYINM
jgi:acetoin utilization protein AcuB